MSKFNSKVQHINVSVRIRPNDNENESKMSPFLEVLSRKELLTRTIYGQKRYVFDRVFDAESTQQEIYNAIVSPLIPEVIDGYNCTVFAYGQTGTGKTYTMEGIHNIDSQINAGIIPRSLAQIFRVLDSVNTESSVKVSYLELYNEELFDLLSQESTPKAIKIYEDKSQKGSVILQGLEELSVTNFNQVYKILEHGTDRRRIASTFLNSTSSRSHTVFTIVVHLREITVDGEELIKTGKLNLVDLAGSENISKSGAIDKRAREAGNINQSLLTLGRVIKALTEKTTHIPYRESKLTRILQDSLGGHTKTSLIATISSTNANHEETLNTLEYAKRAKDIQNKPEVNQKISRTALINQYSDTIEKLQRDLVAVRSGTGFFVDETNYTTLVEQTEVQRAELLEKTKYIQKLEEDLSDYTESLRTLKTSWAEAANNIEQLSNAKRILEKDLILVKENNKQKEQELQLVKEKHEHLTDETEKLLSDIQIHSLNEEVFHKKVSYLYQTSQMNRNISKMFYNMHNKLSTKVMYHIDSCINTTQKLMMAQETTWSQNNPQMVFNQLARNVDNLQQILNSMQNYTVENFENKESLQNKYASYYNTLQRIIKNMNERSYTFRNEFISKLVCVRDDIKHIADENTTDLKSIMTELMNIRDMASNEVTSISYVLQEFQSKIMDNIDELMDHAQKLDQKENENFNTISDIKQGINLFMEKCNSRFSNYETQHQEVLHINSDLIKKIASFKGNTYNSLEVLTTDVVTKLDMLQKADNASVSYLNTFNDKLELSEKKANDCIMESARYCKENFVCFEEEEFELLNHEKQKCEIESTEDTHYVEITNAICDAKNRVESIKVDIHSVVDKHKIWNEEFLNKSNEIKSTLENGHKICSDTSKNMKCLVDDLCGCKLNYPTHAGDTPQKVQPKSSLYKNTLTKNSFNDDEKNMCRVQNANKENSSTPMNVKTDHT